MAGLPIKMTQQRLLSATIRRTTHGPLHFYAGLPFCKLSSGALLGATAAGGSRWPACGLVHATLSRAFRRSRRPVVGPSQWPFHLPMSFMDATSIHESWMVLFLTLFLWGCSAYGKGVNAGFYCSRLTRSSEAGSVLTKGNLCVAHRRLFLAGLVCLWLWQKLLPSHPSCPSRCQQLDLEG